VSSVRGGAQKAVSIVRRESDDLILKVIALSGSSPVALHRAQREVDLLRALDNVHVVRVVSDLVEVGEPPHAAAWLEECLDGRDLTAALTEVWTWDQAATMALDVSHGLAAAHERRVVHRDLSPNNVRQLGSGRYKVMDFGFARHLGLSGLTLGVSLVRRGFLAPNIFFPIRERRPRRPMYSLWASWRSLR
jgi:eukaryotic-like serine/threonine-protein kinase